MALTGQPYLPLYVQDWLSNNKLKFVSAGGHGLLINIMCIMHKGDDYGRILLKQKFKQSPDQIKNFALMFAQLLPFDLAEIELYLRELIEEEVLYIDGDVLYNKRMVRDAEISNLRQKAGSKGGKVAVAKKFAQAKSQANSRAKAQAKGQAKHENENENENNNINNNNSNNNDIYNNKSIEYIEGESKREGESGEAEACTIETPVREHPLQKFIRENLRNVSKMEKQLTYEEAERLVEEFPKAVIRDILYAMENYKPLTKKNTSVNLTIRNWIRRQNDETTIRGTQYNYNRGKGAITPELLSELRSVQVDGSEKETGSGSQIFDGGDATTLLSDRLNLY